jgi:hypothetical protein
MKTGISQDGLMKTATMMTKASPEKIIRGGGGTRLTDSVKTRSASIRYLLNPIPNLATNALRNGRNLGTEMM